MTGFHQSFIMLTMIFVIAAAAAGCARTETYGEKISSRSITSLRDILSSSKNYDGKTVTIKGKIAIECETGCWFNFKEGDAMIYVNIEPSGFAIPQRSGRNAIIFGDVAIKEGKPILIGKGIEIR